MALSPMAGAFYEWDENINLRVFFMNIWIINYWKHELLKDEYMNIKVSTLNLPDLLKNLTAQHMSYDSCNRL